MLTRAGLKPSSCWLPAPAAGTICRFSYSLDERTFTSIGGEFAARPGVWIGAKGGLFAVAPPGAAGAGHADWSWFRVEDRSSLGPGTRSAR